MKARFIFLLLLLPCIATYAQHPYVQKFDNLAQITFPDTPTVKHVEASGSDVYYISRGVGYVAQNSDMEKTFADLFTMSNDSIYNGFIKGTLSGTKGKLLKKKKIKLGEITGVEFSYKAPLNGVITYRRQRLIYTNSKIIMFGIWSADSLSDNDKPTTDFFNTFKLNISNREV